MTEREIVDALHRVADRALEGLAPRPSKRVEVSFDDLDACFYWDLDFEFRNDLEGAAALAAVARVDQLLEAEGLEAEGYGEGPSCVGVEGTVHAC